MDLRSNLDYYSVDTMNNSLEDDKDSKDGNNKKPRIAHSEVEKRRREKMNKYLFDLVPYLPQGLINKNKKLDKITILKLAVQHMKYLKDSNLCQPKNNNHKKNIYTNNELESLMFNSSEQLTNGFLFVIKCDTNKIIYATDSCFKCIGQNSNELIDKVFYDLIHPSDIKYTKEQLSYVDLINSINTANNFMLEKTTNNLPGSRRSFVCRVQKGGSRSSSSSTNNDDHHQLVHFVGYVRCECLTANLSASNRPKIDNELLLNEMLMAHQQSTSTSSVSSPSSSSVGAIDQSNNNKLHPLPMHPFANADFAGFPFPQLLEYSLILHGQIKHQVMPSQDEFLTKYDLDGKIVYVEPSVNAVFGYLEHELLGNSLKEYVHPEDLNSLLNKIKEAISTKEKVKTQGYRFRLKKFDYAAVESSLYALQNPFNNKIECIISSNKKI